MGKFIPHKIPPESIKEGDTILASWKTGSVKRTIEATVGRIIFDSYGMRSRSFVTPEGDEIVHWAPGSRVTFTLTAEKPILGTPLAGMEFAHGW